VADKPKDNGPCKACHGRGGVMTVLPDKNGKLRRGWLQCTVCSGTGRDPGY
jgi:DnaJ-class molecular chaperone